jgi:hypothetical protein
VIDDGMRRGLLGQFPAGVPLTVFAAGTAFYTGIATERPATTVLPLDGGAPLPPVGDTNVIVDGLHAVPDPGRALDATRRVTSGARVFALVANAAYAVAVANFLAGEEVAAGHPIVAAGVDELFAANGWRVIDRVPLIDRQIAGAVLPFTITVRDMIFTVTSAEIAERMSSAGFLVVADPT